MFDLTTLPSVEKRNRSSRRRVRTVNDDRVLADAVQAAIAEPCKLKVRVSHGGSVSNNYGYRADTECVFASAFVVDGRLFVRRVCSSLAANKVTHSGVAARAECREIFDPRYGEQKTELARLREVGRLMALPGIDLPKEIEVAVN